jgi:hypothetical protein
LLGERNSHQGGGEKQSDEQKNVAQARDQKCLGCSYGVFRLLVPVPDKEEGTGAHAFPTEEHEESIFGSDQNEHCSREEVEVAKVTPFACVALHVRIRVQMDEQANAGYNEREGEGYQIEVKRG